MTEYMKPSEVLVTTLFPSVGVFGKAEIGIAVAAGVLASTVRDAWEPVTTADLAAADKMQNSALSRWLANPFYDFGRGIELAIAGGLLEHAKIKGELDTLRVLPPCLDVIARREEATDGE